MTINRSDRSLLLVIVVIAAVLAAAGTTGAAALPATRLAGAPAAPAWQAPPPSAGAPARPDVTVFYEDFSDFDPIPAAPPYHSVTDIPDWDTHNVDGRTPAGAVSYITDAWIVREDFNFNVTDSCAFSTSWYVPSGAADDWMVTPPIALPATGALTLSWNAVTYDDQYPDGYEVRLATNAGTVVPGDFATVLFSIAAENSAWTSRQVSLTAWAGQTVRIAFRNNSNDQFLLLVDDVLVSQTTAYDARVSAPLLSEYTLVPTPLAFPIPLGATVSNVGSQALTNVVLTAVVKRDGTPVATSSSPAIASLASGASQAVTLPDFAVTATGQYTVDYAVAATETDDDPANNALTAQGPLGTSDEMARDDNVPVGFMGIGAGNGGELGTEYTLPGGGTLVGIRFYHDAVAADRGLVGQQLVVNIRDMATGEPGSLLTTSAPYTVVAGPALWVDLPLAAGPITLPAGGVYAGLVEPACVDCTIALGQAATVFTAGTGWVNWPTSPMGGWANIEEFGANFARAQMVRLVLAQGSVTPDYLRVDLDAAPAPASNLNGVLEVGEEVVVSPGWHNVTQVGFPLTGTAAGFAGAGDGTWDILDAASDFGTMTAGGTMDPFAATANAYLLHVGAPTARPATHWDATVTESVSTGVGHTWTLHIGGSFTDVAVSATPGSFYSLIETLLHSGTTAGCTGTAYCPTSTVTRAQMGMFVARAMNDGADAAVPVTGTIAGRGDYNCIAGGQSQFGDVLPEAMYCRHVHYMAVHEVTVGCSGGVNYCPLTRVTRGAMAMFVARAMLDGDANVPTAYTDPVTLKSYDCTTPASLFFTDVLTTDQYCRHAHYLWARNVIAGCGATTYCPSSLVRRDQMAKFLVNGFGFTLYGP